MTDLEKITAECTNDFEVKMRQLFATLVSSCVSELVYRLLLGWM